MGRLVQPRPPALGLRLCATRRVRRSTSPKTGESITTASIEAGAVHKAKKAAERCANLRPRSGHDALNMTKRVLRSIARRFRALDNEITELEAELDTLVRLAAPRLMAEHSVGPQTAAKLLSLAGDNPERLRNEAAFAALCGASPVEASSGKTQRHRLNRGGDRQANNALYTIAMVRMQHHPETKAYIARRVAEGKTRREARRCVMRHLARRLFPLLVADIQDAKTIPLLT